MSTKRKADAIMRRKVDRFMRAVTLEATSRFVRRTPVDTGRARGNWNAEVNKPDLTYDPERLDKPGTATIGLAAPKIRTIGFFDGDEGYVANAVPYVRYLEEGSSAQAPEGMVRVTLEELRPWIQRNARRFRG